MSNDRVGGVLSPEEQTAARPGRCANHPASLEVGQCAVCGRALCLTCATPVRGDLVGPECLSAVLDEIPAPTPVAIRVPAIADRLVIAGFGLVVALSILPWSRYGDSSGYLEAWTLHWSALAALAGLIGLASAIWFLKNPADPRLEVGLHSGLSLLVVGAALLHHRHPPPISASAVTPLLAILAGLIALSGAMIKWRTLRAPDRP